MIMARVPGPVLFIIFGEIGTDALSWTSSKDKAALRKPHTQHYSGSRVQAFRASKHKAQGPNAVGRCFLGRTTGPERRLTKKIVIMAVGEAEDRPGRGQMAQSKSASGSCQSSRR